MSLNLSAEQRQDWLDNLPASVARYRARLIAERLPDAIADRLVIEYQRMVLACIYDINLTFHAEQHP